MASCRRVGAHARQARRARRAGAHGQAQAHLRPRRYAIALMVAHSYGVLTFRRSGLWRLRGSDERTRGARHRAQGGADCVPQTLDVPRRSQGDAVQGHAGEEAGRGQYIRSAVFTSLFFSFDWPLLAILFTCMHYSTILSLIFFYSPSILTK
jgi:hypothetical protein